jgi:hypothetical protein
MTASSLIVSICESGDLENTMGNNNNNNNDHCGVVHMPVMVKFSYMLLMSLSALLHLQILKIYLLVCIYCCCVCVKYCV